VHLLLMPNRHLSNFRNAKRLCLFCLMRQKRCWNYFSFPFSLRQNSSSSYFVSWGKIHDFTLADQDWIGLMIFKNFADQDWIGFSFCGSRLGSDWKICQSAHLCCILGSFILARCWTIFLFVWNYSRTGTFLCKSIASKNIQSDMNYI